ncbi:MAG: putative DNA binding domain-containing protein, partial [Firmicutes bacterium]|nr:putative DNA binding domain-containing protein [Bacillota bacterium]
MAESQNIEWKESWRDEYLKWICGFANAQGGKIYIGIKDDGRVIGVKNSKKLLEDIPNKIRNTMGIVADVNLYEKEGLEYLEIIVSPSSFPVSYYGEFHYRSGSTKQLLTGIALSDFIMKRAGVHWEDAIVEGITMDDIDDESIKIFKREARRCKRMKSEDLNVSTEELLEKLHLTENGKLKRSAVLLFTNKCEIVQTGSYTKVGHFGVGSDLQYQDLFEGSLINTADKIIDVIYLKYLKAAITYSHDRRIETYPYARDAIREAIYNALVHNCYMFGSPIQIRISDEEMRISNSCILPSGWTLETLLGPHTSEPYNPNIARVFYLAGYIETWGRGVEKIFETCEELG